MNHAICSSTLMRLLSSTTASGACRRGDTARLMSALSRSRTLRSISSSDTSSPLARRLVVAAPRPHGGVGRHEDLQFGVGEDHRADVAAVHHHAAAASHLLLHGHELRRTSGMALTRLTQFETSMVRIFPSARSPFT